MKTKKPDYTGGAKVSVIMFLLTYGWVIFVVLIVIGALIYIKIEQVSFIQSSKWSEGSYDYCVEWDGWIYREDLFFNCYDMETQKIRCVYNINVGNQLVVDLFEDEENYVPKQTQIFNCTRYLQSIYLIKK